MAVDNPMYRAQEELGTAISKILGRHDLMLNRWLLITEVIDAGGARQAEMFAPVELTSWDSLGLLEAAGARERGKIVGNEVLDAMDRREQGEDE